MSDFFFGIQMSGYFKKMTIFWHFFTPETKNLEYLKKSDIFTYNPFYHLHRCLTHANGEIRWIGCDDALDEMQLRHFKQILHIWEVKKGVTFWPFIKSKLELTIWDIIGSFVGFTLNGQL